MKFSQILLSLFVTSMLAACGGGGGGGGSTATTISGSIVEGQVNGAAVTAYAISNSMQGSQIATATTDTSGNFHLSVGGYAGPVMLQMRGGTYIDEATGTAMVMAPGDVMSAVLPTVTAGASLSGIQVTPLTSMAQAMAQHMAGGLTDANIAMANTAIGNYFSVNDILHTQPMNPLVAGSGTGASQDMRNYGATLAAMSQYAKTLGMPASSALITAMMNDASDGIMNGMNGSSQITMSMGGMMGGSMMTSTAGTSGLATAMTNFMNSSANVSGLTAIDMAALIQKLINTNGMLL